MIGACRGAGPGPALHTAGLPVLLGVILVGYFSFAAVGYWSGHLSNVFGGLGDLGFNVSTSVSGRLQGSTATHLLALHAKVERGRHRRRAGRARAAAPPAAGPGRPRAAGPAVMPIVLIGVVSYGGEIALRTYLFMLPAASVLAAAGLLSRTAIGPGQLARPSRVLAVCAVVLPVAFFLARYGNEAFEQTPPGELAATNWVYAHDAHGARLLWLSTAPGDRRHPADALGLPGPRPRSTTSPRSAPRNPTSVGDLVVGPRARRAGVLPDRDADPGGRHAADRQLSGSAGGSRFERVDGDGPRSGAGRLLVRHRRRLHPALARRRTAQPLGSGAPAPPARFTWTQAGVLVFLWALLALMAMTEFTRIWRPSARLRRSGSLRPCSWCCSATSRCASWCVVMPAVRPCCHRRAPVSTSLTEGVTRWTGLEDIERRSGLAPPPSHAVGLEFWREYLTGVAGGAGAAPGPPETRRGAPESAALPPSIGAASLDEELTTGLRALSHHAQVTLPMTLTAAFSTLLHRYTGQEDFSSV